MAACSKAGGKIRRLKAQNTSQYCSPGFYPSNKMFLGCRESSMVRPLATDPMVSGSNPSSAKLSLNSLISVTWCCISKILSKGSLMVNVKAAVYDEAFILCAVYICAYAYVGLISLSLFAAWLCWDWNLFEIARISESFLRKRTEYSAVGVQRNFKRKAEAYWHSEGDEKSARREKQPIIKAGFRI